MVSALSSENFLNYPWINQCWIQVMQNTQSGILGLELAYPEAQLFKLGTDFSMFGEKQQQMMQRGVWCQRPLPSWCEPSCPLSLTASCLHLRGCHGSVLSTDCLFSPSHLTLVQGSDAILFVFVSLVCCSGQPIMFLTVIRTFDASPHLIFTALLKTSSSDCSHL